MACSDSANLQITPQVLLKAYACGIFPMADSADDPTLFWIEPDERGILPLADFHIPRSLAKTIRKDTHKVVVNRDFVGVLNGCAEAKVGRESTWINSEIRRLYTALFETQYCHTVEVYNAEDQLVGGLYGVQLGGAFFGESMFSRERDVSKIALVHLIARLKAGGFGLLDTQFVTDHLSRFGAKEISKHFYHKLLGDALDVKCDFIQGNASFNGVKALELAKL